MKAENLIDVMEELKNDWCICGEGKIVIKEGRINISPVFVGITGTCFDHIGMIVDKYYNCYWYVDFEYGYIVVFKEK